MNDARLVAHFSGVRRKVSKWAHYLPIYDSLLAEYRGRPVTLLEVGVDEGGSLEGWRSYLGPEARIIGIDSNAATQLGAEGFEVIIGDQADREFWAEQLPRIGPIDVVIDDGGHSNTQQIVTVASVLASVRDGGLIVVEDTHSAFMPKQYPAARGFGIMDFARHITDVMQTRNPMTVDHPEDTAGFAGAIHRVQFFESMIVFHVDRRLCGRSVPFEAGWLQSTPHVDRGRTLMSRAVEVFDAQPPLVQSMLRPGRRVVGVIRRTVARIHGAWRVRDYFR